MKLVQTILILVCALVFHLPLQAQPVNVLVGDLTFTRPEQWSWESSTSGKSNVLTRFVIPNDSGKGGTADVRFYLTQKNAAEATALWKSYFPQIKQGKDLWAETKQIGKHDLTYVSLTGTQIYPGSKPKPNCTFFGAIIPSGNDFVHVRLFGPRDEVEKASALFKTMVEDALKEAE